MFTIQFDGRRQELAVRSKHQLKFRREEKKMVTDNRSRCALKAVFSRLPVHKATTVCFVGKINGATYTGRAKRR